MKQTPMQELIERFKKLQLLYEKDSPQYNVFGICINEATELLEKEEQVIKDTYWDGGEDIPLTEKRCEDYYNEQFKQK